MNKNLTRSSNTSIVEYRPNFELINQTNSFLEVYNTARERPSIGFLSQHHGSEQCGKWIMKVVVKYNDMFAENKRLAAEHCLVIRDFVLQNYPNYRLSEIALVFKYAILGKYQRDSKVFGQLDVPTVMMWFRIYDESRWRRIDLIKRGEEAKVKNEPMSKEAKDLMRKVFIKLGEKSRLESTEIKDKTRKTYLPSITQYCDYFKYDENEVMEIINHKMEDFGEISPEVQIYYRAIILDQLNNGVKPIDLIIQNIEEE